MTAFINQLYPDSESNAIRNLFQDESSREIIEKHIGQKILNHKEILNELPLTQLMFLLSISPFAKPNECHDVAEIVYWGIHQKDIFPLVTEYKGEELANRCLVSLSLFKKALIHKYNRHGAPHPDYYRKAGIDSFISIGKKDIGKHFIQWENFIGELLIIE